MNGTPRYEHRCTRCAFVGQSGKFDLYLHVGWTPEHTRLKARSGNFDWQVKTGRIDDNSEILRTARVMAVASGFGDDLIRANT